MAEQRIDDHSFWAGKAEEGSVFPKGPKVKNMRSGEGAGDLRDYPDSEREIQRDQDEAVRDVERRPMPAGKRF